MCGRYTCYSSPAKIARQFAIHNPFIYEISYNIAPTEQVLVVCDLEGLGRRALQMRWGLIPSWQNPHTAGALINARIETIDSKPSFRNAIKSNRCLIIADGFYEWTEEQSGKQPYYIQMKDKLPFAMAGIWERNVTTDKAIDSTCIITLDANALITPYHDRMPGIILPENYDEWLSQKTGDMQHVKTLVSEIEPAMVTIHKVTKKVNRAKYKGSDCIYTLS